MVTELRQAWSELSTKLGGRTLHVDLTDVISVDQAGLAVLAEIHRTSGAKFQAGLPLTQYFAEQATQIQSDAAFQGA